MTKFVGIITAIIAVAIIAVLVGTRSQTSNVITAAAKALSSILGVVVAPANANGGGSSGGTGEAEATPSNTGYANATEGPGEMLLRMSLNSGDAGSALGSYITAMNGGTFSNASDLNPPQFDEPEPNPDTVSA